MRAADVEYVRVIASAPAEATAGVEFPADKFPVKRTGWPDEWVQPAGI